MWTKNRTVIVVAVIAIATAAFGAGRAGTPAAQVQSDAAGGLSYRCLSCPWDYKTASVPGGPSTEILPPGTHGVLHKVSTIDMITLFDGPASTGTEIATCGDLTGSTYAAELDVRFENGLSAKNTGGNVFGIKTTFFYRLDPTP
jgi:hypothetical protein